MPIVAYEITGSYAASGFAQAGMVAQLVFGPFGGVIADRYKKKPLVLGSQIIPCAIIVATGILIVSDNITIPLLFGSTFLTGATFSLMGPARQSWVVELVPHRLLPNAVALQNMSINIAAVVGPALAATLVVSMGLNSGILYMLVAIPFVIVIPLTIMISGSGRATPPEERKPVATEMAAGLRYITSRPNLRSLWVFWTMIVVTGFALQTLLPGLLDQEFGRPENEALIIGTIWGVTALPINLMLAGVVGSRRWPWPLLFLSALALAGGIWLTAWAPVYGVLLIVSRHRWRRAFGGDAAQSDDHDVEHAARVLRACGQLGIHGLRSARHPGAGLGGGGGRDRRSGDALRRGPGGCGGDGVDDALASAESADSA